MTQSVLGEIVDKEHVYSYYVDYNETDAGGIVYHANYLSIAEKARSAFYRLIGENIKKETCFVVKDVFINYIAPAKFDWLLNVRSKIISVGAVKVVFEQNFYYKDKLLCTIKLNLASIGHDLALRKMEEKYKNILSLYIKN